MRHRFDCAVVGDAMIDILLPLSGIEDLHSLAQGGVTNTKMRLSFGGSANIAYYITKLGGNSIFMGRVGDDYFGKLFLEALEENGIPASVSVTKGENTGMVFVLVFPNGERFFIDDRGANARLGWEDFDPGLIRDSKYFFFSGFSFQDKEFPANIQRLLEGVVGDASVVFNPGAPNLAKEFKDSFTDLIGRYVSILILNEAEGRYLTGCDLEKKMIDCLLSMANTVALTKGDKGSIIATKSEVHHIRAKRVKVVDTTGAGDAYAAGFIYGLSQGWKAGKAGEFASTIAERVVTQFGARVDFPKPNSQ